MHFYRLNDMVCGHVQITGGYSMDKYQILKKYFGYDTFREGQEPLIDSILSGRDVLGILPTGAGD